MNENLDDLKIELINKYLSIEYTSNDLINKSVNNEKIEHTYINDLIMKGLDDSLDKIEVLILFALSIELSINISKFRKLIEKYFNNRKYNEELINNFIEDYEIDIEYINKRCKFVLRGLL